MAKIKEYKNEIKEKDLNSLNNELKERQKNLVSLMMKESTNEQKNPAKIKRLKKEIALIRTIIREKIEQELENSPPNQN